jgi:RNA polymerase sigma factor (sigma-70 family)
MRNRPNQEELELIELCKKNNNIAQKRLYDKYKDGMYTIALRITGNEDDAIEALQDAFIQIFNGISSFLGKSTLGAWIKTIVVRTAIRKVKNEIRFENIDSIKKEMIYWPENTNGEILEKAINQLDTGYRTVFLLIEVEGYKHKEVSEMLSISVGTSKSQLFHAKRILQKKISQLL